MKRLAILTIIASTFAFAAYSQNLTKLPNPSYRYVSNNGFVNITELGGAKGLGDTSYYPKSQYYFEVTNVFGYQISRNFYGGIGVGCYFYDSGQLFPLFLDYRYSIYLKGFTAYIYSDGGLLVDPEDINGLSKIFINPGIGVSRSISSKFEVTFSSGLMIQMGSNMPQSSFVNFKVGMIYRKNSFRLYKPTYSRKKWLSAV